MGRVLCRTCLQVSDARFFALSDTMPLPTSPSVREALSACVPEMNLEAFAQSVICCSCFIGLSSAYKFKTKCIKTEEVVTTFMNIIPDEGESVDLNACVLKSQMIKPQLDKLLEEVEDCVEEKDVPEHVEIKLEAVEEPVCTPIPCFPPPLLKKVKSEPLFKCKRCPRCYTTKSNLTAHYRSEHGQEPPIDISQLTCRICKFTAPSVTDLQQHKATHVASNSYMCDQCGFKTIHFNSLSLHMRTHTGEKPYTCTYCDYRARMSSTMQSHLRRHTGEKRYVCDRCGYKATAGSALRVHMRSHTGAKPYKCNECSFAAINSGHLKDHKRTHSGERPFSCGLCPYSAMTRKHLKQHMKRHAGKQE